MEHIAFLGLGHMGAPMARRLLAAGHPLTVWNRTAEKAAPLVAEGAVAAASPADAVRDADVVITMLAGPEALEAVTGAISPALRPGTHWIDMSTVGPEAVRRLDRFTGVSVVDAPVMGSTDKAAAGTLGILAGGDTARVEHVLAHLGTVTRTGPLGSGAALKLVVNSAVIGGIAVVAEALRLADALGLDGETARAALANSPLGGAVARAFAEGVHFDTALAVKDLALATQAAELPVTEAALSHYRRVAEPGTDISVAAARIRTTLT
ncbi:NAD(P)-dependent oxidoreductase [Streptomyces justiciae]|uniref:NAD(P)-dependent oxidoreductase n=1 Tax=Streptomyces justiciae TaxID=2780140 RepID=UPI002119576D|nr:NAD(P)-dependent oxidoreductase [Streptomyces justiciae]MCW8381869.1 NAD(P)-dependent oxidoreductase [Streptomyces justiciae]